MDKRFSKNFKLILISLVVVFAFGSGILFQSTTGHLNNKPSTIPTTRSKLSPTPVSGISEENQKEPEPSDVLSATYEASESSTISTNNTVSGRSKAKVVRVVDGDTIELEDGTKVRYIGVDTPETVKPNTPVQCFGKDASVKNKSLVEGKEVELEKDVSETDRYGRLLRYVYVGEVFVNKYLVDEGFAYSSSYPPDVKYQEIFKEAQRAAQEAKKGLWNSCPVDPKKVVEAPSGVLGVSTTASPPLVAATPAESSVPTSTGGGSATSVPTARASHSGCVIKGNISSSGKIYHLPGCGSYDKTTVSESQGERWFCSEQDAINAGWRKAKNC